MKTVREEEVKLRGIGFVKKVHFESEVKEKVIDEQSGESEEDEVMGEGTGVNICHYAAATLIQFSWKTKK